VSTAPAVSAVPRLCDECSYDLRGIESDFCPECGQPISDAALSISQIPWTKAGGGYWATVWMVLRWPHRLAREVRRPTTPDLRRAAHFYWISLAIGLTPLAVAFVWPSIAPSGYRANYLPYTTSEKIRALGVAILLALAVVHRCFCMVRNSFVSETEIWAKHHGEKRAIAVSRYAAAPIVLTPCFLLLAATCCWIRIWLHPEEDFWDYFQFSLLPVSLAGALVCFVGFLRVERLMSRRRGQIFDFFAYILPAWFFIGLAYFGLVPTIANVAAEKLASHFPHFTGW